MGPVHVSLFVLFHYSKYVQCCRLFVVCLSQASTSQINCIFYSQLALNCARWLPCHSGLNRIEADYTRLAFNPRSEYTKPNKKSCTKPQPAYRDSFSIQ